MGQEATAQPVKREHPAAPSLMLVPTMSAEEERVLPVLLRYFVYACILTLLMLLFGLVANIGGIGEFTEGGLVETGQVLVLLSAATIFLIGVGRRAESRGLFVALAAAVVAAVFREHDALLDEFNPLLGWKLPVALTILTGAVLVYRCRESFRRGLGQLVRGPAFTLLWCGFLIAVPIAQNFGTETLLKVLWEELYIREQKRVIEEICEFLGYALILIGAIELTLFNRTPACSTRVAAVPAR